MEHKNETEIIWTENQETESLENPFTKLAPEVVAHILSFLNDIPSRMAAVGVCHLWRKLVDWKEVKQLQLDFGQMSINEVPLGLAKWSTALESLLPKIKLTSFNTLLPAQAQTKPSKPGLYLPWPLCLLDCEVAINQLTNQQAASLSHITHVRIFGRPDNPEFEFMCHLLELCPSLTHLDIKLNSDKFDLGLLKSALSSKSLLELDITLSHLTGICSSENLAELCQVLAPGTLKTLALNIGCEDPGDHPHLLILDHFCIALHNNSCRLSALESLIIRAPWLETIHKLPYMDPVQFESFSKLPSLVNHVFPELKTVELTIPALDHNNWIMFHSMFAIVSSVRKRPLHISLSTRQCILFEVYLGFKLTSDTNPLISHQVNITEEGFNCTALRQLGVVAPIEFHYKRMPCVCTCVKCRSEYGLVKQQIISRLNGEPSLDQIGVFSCHIPRLQVDLMDLFPGLSVSPVQNGSVKIKVESKTQVRAAVIQHNSVSLGNICAGCGMLPPLVIS